MRAHISIIWLIVHVEKWSKWDLKRPGYFCGSREESFAIAERFRDKNDVSFQGDSLIIDKRCETIRRELYRKEDLEL